MNSNKIRSATKPGRDAMTRLRAAWGHADCTACGYACSWRVPRVGRMIVATGVGAADGTRGHVRAMTDSESGGWTSANLVPLCAACNYAQGTKDMTNIFPAGPAWPSIGEAKIIVANLGPDTRDPATMATREQRDAARIARYGW